MYPGGPALPPAHLSPAFSLILSTKLLTASSSWTLDLTANFPHIRLWLPCQAETCFQEGGQWVPQSLAVPLEKLPRPGPWPVWVPAQGDVMGSSLRQAWIGTLVPGVAPTIPLLPT